MDTRNTRQFLDRQLASSGALVTTQHADAAELEEVARTRWIAAHHAGELPDFLAYAEAHPDFESSALLRHLAGNALITLCRPDEALVHLDAAITGRSLDPHKQAVSLCSRAVAREALGDREGAREDLDAAESGFPTYVGVHINRLVCACHASSGADVVDAFRRLQQAHPAWRSDVELRRLLETDVELRFARTLDIWTKEVGQCVA